MYNGLGKTRCQQCGRLMYCSKGLCEECGKYQPDEVVSRIPELQDETPEGVLLWFVTMANRGLAFHPEDDPADIVLERAGRRTFSSQEALELNEIMPRIYALVDDPCAVALEALQLIQGEQNA